jgi:hypothetical protein
MEMSKKGEPVLVPFPGEAVRALREMFDQVVEPADVLVVVLPYAPTPPELDAELQALMELGISVVRPVPGSERWPKYSRRNKLDNTFQDGLYFSLMEMTGAEDRASPSECFAIAAQRTRSFIVADGAISSVDEIAMHRREFIKRAVESLEQMADGRPVGSFDAYFEGAGLTYASSGGITAKVEVWRGGRQIASQATNNHLKQGDSTSRVAAVRIYFDTVQDGDHRLVVVLFAGPHPDADVSRRVELPDNQPDS